MRLLGLCGPAREALLGEKEEREVLRGKEGRKRADERQERKGVAEEEEKERRLGRWDPARVLPHTDSLPHPSPHRVHLARLAPLGLRALQVCKGCPVRGEQLASLGPRETG